MVLPSQLSPLGARARRVGVSVALGAALMAGVVAAPAAQAQSRFENLTAEERAALREELRDYLLEEPEILAEASRVLEQRRVAAALAEALKDVEAGAVVADVNPEPAEVLMIEFTDYQCRYCRLVRPEVDDFLAANPEVRYVARALPRVGSELPERAAIAASLQSIEMATELHVAMMVYNDELDLEAIIGLAEPIGLDVQRLMRDMAGGEVAERVSRADAVAANLGIRGTPGFVIGDIVIPGAVPSEEMEAVLAQYRASQAE